MTSDYDKSKYEQDFPDHGDFNWVKVRINTPKQPYYHNHKTIGVLLHDGKFMTYGIVFEEGEFEIMERNILKGSYAMNEKQSPPVRCKVCDQILPIDK